MSSSQIGPANMSQNKPQKTEKSVKKFNYFVEQQNSLCACSYRRIAKLCRERRNVKTLHTKKDCKTLNTQKNCNTLYSEMEILSKNFTNCNNGLLTDGSYSVESESAIKVFNHKLQTSMKYE
jgi:hypothetical protein